MNPSNTLGVRTFIYYLCQKVLFSFLLFFLSFILPSISVASIKAFNIDPSYWPIIGKIGSLVVSILFFLSILLIILGVFFSWIKHISTRYTLDDYAFRLKRGIISKEEISIPYKQIQNVNIKQSVIFKMLGLASMVVLSAGNEEDHEHIEADQIFNVIDNDVAEYLRSELLKKAGERK
ncbi:MAG: PH domain-containing protein [Candidatus Paceibacterota bacterium]